VSVVHPVVEEVERDAVLRELIAFWKDNQSGVLNRSAG
jgi:hypothetical protein